MPKRKLRTKTVYPSILTELSSSSTMQCLSFLSLPELLCTVTLVCSATRQMILSRQAWSRVLHFDYVQSEEKIGTSLHTILQRFARIGGFSEVDLSAAVL